MVVPTGWVSTDEISQRIGRLQRMYAGNPLIARIDHQVGSDWSGDPAVFVNVVLADPGPDPSSLRSLADQIRLDLLLTVRAEDLGLYSYLNFTHSLRG